MSSRNSPLQTPSVRDPQVAAQQAIVEVVRAAWASHQVRNPSFSLRAFARRVGVTPAELSLILNGKRRLSRRLAAKLLAGIAAEPAQAQRLLAALPEKMSRRKRATGTVAGAAAPTVRTGAAPVLQYIQLSTDEFRVVADWFHLAILSLSDTAGFRSDVKWIARRLRIRVEQARSAVETLVRLGLLAAHPQGRRVEWKPTGKKFTTTNDISDVSLRKNHSQGLELANEALHTVPVELREFGASIIAADPSLLPQAKARLRELRREIAQLLESGQKKEVYRLQIQLIPVSHRDLTVGESK